MGIRCAAFVVGVFGIWSFTADALAQCKLGTLEHTPNLVATDIDTEGPLIFIANGYQEFVIIDASDPGNPVELWTAELSALAVDVVGSVAFVLTPTEFVVLDVSNPSQPGVLSTLGLDVASYFVEIADSVAFIGGPEEEQALTAIDVSNPLNPIVIGKLQDVHGEAIEIEGSFAYLAGQDGIQIVDIGDPAAMVLCSVYHRCNGRCVHPLDLVVVNNILYFVGSYNRMSDVIGVLDVSNPDTPIVLNDRLVSGKFQHLDLIGTTAYVTSETNGQLSAFDISNPSDIRLLRTQEVSRRGGYMDVSIAGDRMVVAVVGGIELYDVGEGCGPCPADINLDGQLDSTDFETWLDAYQSDNISADQNLDQRVQPNDFSAWLANFNVGCGF